MQQITTQECRSWIEEQKNFTLIDVRETWEHDAFSIGGNNIPMGELMERKNEIPDNETVVVYCEKGIRSVIAIQRLESMGYTNLYNLAGGMYAWRLMP
jgi:adenylyltransferase/sulfurtransferase